MNWDVANGIIKNLEVELESKKRFLEGNRLLLLLLSLLLLFLLLLLLTLELSLVQKSSIKTNAYQLTKII